MDQSHHRIAPRADILDARWLADDPTAPWCGLDGTTVVAAFATQQQAEHWLAAQQAWAAAHA